jgi:hypothetical protein
MVSVYHDGDARDRAFFEAATNYLWSLKECLRQTLRTPEALQPLFNEFPKAIRNLTTAVFQRRETAFPRPFTTPGMQVHFAHSEVALGFPLTIRAAEAVNEQYHRRVSLFYERFKPSSAPLVNLAGGSVATLQTQPLLAAATAQDDVNALCSHLLNLSCVTMPRWSSEHIRTFAFAAHEHIHRIFWLVEAARKPALKKFAIEFGDNADRTRVSDDPDERSRKSARYLDIADEAKPAVGLAIVDIHKLCHTFAFHFRAFFAANQIPKLRGCSEELRESYRRYLAWHHMIEILADTGATVIAGPAFLFSYRTGYQVNSAEELKAMYDLLPNTRAKLSEHPPSAVRILLQIDLLRHMGFNKLAECFEQEFADEWRAIEQAPDQTILVEYRRFTQQEPFQALLFQFAQAITEAAYQSDPTPCYHLPFSNQDEADVLRRWLEVADQVEERGDFFSEDVREATAADLINAIWIKRCPPRPHGAKNRLAWRAALRNYIHV